jgi:rhodanese-related sulfurtransferase
MKIAEDNVLDYFRTKQAAYASPMAVARALKLGVESPLVVVDVRNPVSTIPTTIEGAMWIPEAQIKQRMHELPKDKTLILVCWDTWCSLATSAAIPLLENGFQVKELNGGIAAWKTLHLPETPLQEGLTSESCSSSC